MTPNEPTHAGRNRALMAAVVSHWDRPRSRMRSIRRILTRCTDTDSQSSAPASDSRDNVQVKRAGGTPCSGHCTQHEHVGSAFNHQAGIHRVCHTRSPLHSVNIYQFFNTILGFDEYNGGDGVFDESICGSGGKIVSTDGKVGSQ